MCLHLCYLAKIFIDIFELRVIKCDIRPEVVKLAESPQVKIFKCSLASP